MKASTKRKIRRIISPLRRIGLKNKTFTIISNNCWGGFIYDLFGLKYQTPTIGLYFSSSDYLKFIGNIKYYLDQELVQDKGILNCNVVGRLDDIKLFFLHYNSFEDAKRKWDKRKQRINFNNLLVKFNDQNGFTDNNLLTFLNLKYDNIIFFGGKKYNGFNEHCYVLSTIDKNGMLKDDIKSSIKTIGLRKIKKLLNQLPGDENVCQNS